MMASTSTRNLRIGCAAVCTILALTGYAQDRDSILMHETTLTRPLVVHRQHFRMSAGYSFEIHNAEFSGSTRTRLADDNRAGVGNRFQWLAEYGIFQNLQVSLALTRLSQRIRYGNVTVVDESVYDFFYIRETSGWTDPVLSLAYRLPLPRRLDIVVAATAALPLMPYGNTRPQHRIVAHEGDNALDPPGLYTINYVDRQGAGNGVSVVGWSATGKFRFSETVAVTGVFAYAAPQGVSTEKRWYFTLVDNARFVYEHTAHQRQVPDIRRTAWGIEFQPSPTFNMYSELVTHTSKFGWSSASGEKRKLPEERYRAIRCGYEIVATPRVWLSQFLELPVAGENTPAPVIINTRLRYNMMW